jgi:outer membrane protein assembly factor BamB
MMKRSLSFLLITTLFCLAVSAQEIVQWRGPNRDGIYPGTGLLKTWPEKGPALAWHYDDLGEGHASAAVTADKIFTAGMTKGKGYIFAFDLKGKLLWKVSYGEEWTESWPGSRSTPLICDGKLYFMSGLGRLVCLSTMNGDLVWSVDLLKEFHGRNIKWGMTENLLVDGNRLFCIPGGKDTNIVALDRNTGKLIWVSKGNGELSAYNSPLLISLPARKILVAQTENSILGIDAGNGALLWRHEQTNTYSVHANTPYYRDGYIYCVSGYGRGGVKLKLSDDGSKIGETWRNTSIGNRMGGFIVLGDRIYGLDDANKAWFCVDWNTGKDIYSEKMMGKGNIIYADGMLYCYSELGEVALVQPLPGGFKKISSFEVPYGLLQHWAHLVIRDGMLYVRHGNSLMVYDIRQK